ncbi:hypothetical protein FOMG_17245 [Fusarium oxysporum f. sp. melonis 26406]|uniref:CAP20-virulence factor n=1 Tax=Fusarium oxysporum f. sp. melonis 26406 TaxID=1089452 RepID=W9ZD11_FUSOX|nr:hypothetical protein FOMG_17245 [Fusarium oxysporum f. sp. melonis 26406]KAJ9417904.1 hypothetical protein QL093DRAFT_2104198 [Fusarium oxysporum]
MSSPQHLLNYPVINNGIHAFKSNKYGRRSIKLGNAAYQTFAAPIIPYFSKPYQCVSPYIHKVDSLGGNALDRINKRFPVVKKPTKELYRDTRALILLPYHKGLEGEDHIFQVYSSEAKKNEQAGPVAHGKAAATTVLVVSNETLLWISSFLHQKKTETTNTVNEKINQ